MPPHPQPNRHIASLEQRLERIAHHHTLAQIRTAPVHHKQPLHRRRRRPLHLQTCAARERFGKVQSPRGRRNARLPRLPRQIEPALRRFAEHTVAMSLLAAAHTEATAERQPGRSGGPQMRPNALPQPLIALDKVLIADVRAAARVYVDALVAGPLERPAGREQANGEVRMRTPNAGPGLVRAEFGHLAAAEHIDADEDARNGAGIVEELRVRGAAQMLGAPVVVEQNAVAGVVERAIVGVQFVLPVEAAVVQDAVVPDDERMRHGGVHLLAERAHEALQGRHAGGGQRAFDVEQPALEATVPGEMDERSDRCVRRGIGGEYLLEMRCAGGRLEDDGAEHTDAMPMGGLQPAERRQRDERVTEVAEVIDAGPMVEAVVIPFGGAVYEADGAQVGGHMRYIHLK